MSIDWQWSEPVSHIVKFSIPRLNLVVEQLHAHIAEVLRQMLSDGESSLDT